MTRMTMSEAIVAAIGDAMADDDSIYLMGQDVGVFGGPMLSAKGLWDRFGRAGRIIDSPISEAAMVGTAVGAAMAGSRPIVDLMFAEFLALTMTPLALEGSSVAYRTDGRLTVPLVVRAKCGVGPHRGHAESVIGMLMSFPGLKIAMPSGASDAYGLMRAAIADQTPVVVLEHMSLLHGAKEDVDTGDDVRLGQAAVKRPGQDLTIVATGLMVPRSLRAARQLAEDGVEAEVVDLRSLAPLDADCVLESAHRTGALLIVEESWPTAGPAAETVAQLLRRSGGTLDFPVTVLDPPPTPIPFGADLEAAYVPGVDAIVEAAKAASPAVKETR